MCWHVPPVNDPQYDACPRHREHAPQKGSVVTGLCCKKSEQSFCNMGMLVQGC